MFQIPEHSFSSECYHFNFSEALAGLQAIEEGLETDGSSLDTMDVLGVIQLLKEVADMDVIESEENLEDLSHHFVHVTGELLDYHDPNLWSEVDSVHNTLFFSLVMRCVFFKLHSIGIKVCGDVCVYRLVREEE